MLIYLNGHFINKEDAKISPFDHGFLYGIGLFETFRVYDGHPFLLDDHLERLNQGLAEILIQQQYTRKEINNILQELLEKNQLTNAYIRLNVSAGLGEVGLQVEPYLQPNMIIFPKPLPPSGGLIEKKAVLLKVKRNSPEGNQRLKSHHYLNNVLAKREIGDFPDVEGIFLSEQGYLAEGIVSNLFWIKGNVLYSPSLHTGILNGITRQFVIKLGWKNNLQIREGHYSVEEALEADEMFVTNSIQEIVPITSFEGRNYPGKEGSWVQQFHQDYRQYSKNLWSRHSVGRV
ncbi:4-amino-4-deoxychorismate lyase [Bacillus sp. SORGH_AS 510]|uniref:aminodeoxychorismate lyase n=1 Tax=Bacillus sp. SORGH_AS_0510 TaxID=3041771 RepID=UPI00278012E1|nr:aminodeoxychorismate lyase [Bacillus sp. SORGH_AS_0510]MDQ1146985.1 4-amino-4-deoxychorismate lyase [Bacillus sp. SORGH_AS_0510]